MQMGEVLKVMCEILNVDDFDYSVCLTKDGCASYKHDISKKFHLCGDYDKNKIKLFIKYFVVDFVEAFIFAGYDSDKLNNLCNVVIPLEELTNAMSFKDRHAKQEKVISTLNLYGTRIRTADKHRDTWIRSL